MKIAGVGLCHTDIHFLHARRRVPVRPAVHPRPRERRLGRRRGRGGHRPRPGAAVLVGLGPKCWRCFNCLSGRDNICQNRGSGRGWGQDGGLAEYLVVPRRELVPLTSLDPRIVGPLADAGVTPYHAVRKVAPKLQHVVDRDPHRRRWPRRVRDPVPEAVHRGTGDRGRHRHASAGACARARCRRGGRVGRRRRRRVARAHRWSAAPTRSSTSWASTPPCRPRSRRPRRGGTVAFVGAGGGERRRGVGLVAAAVRGVHPVRRHHCRPARGRRARRGREAADGRAAVPVRRSRRRLRTVSRPATSPAAPW